MWPNTPKLHVSHETSYATISGHLKDELRKDLVTFLCQGKGSGRARSAGEDRRRQIPEMVFSIHVRPREVSDRVMPSHCQGDLINVAGNTSAVGVLVERSTRLLLLDKMPDATANAALATFTFKLNQITAPMPQTPTSYQCEEMAMHHNLAKATSLRLYFCDR